MLNIRRECVFLLMIEMISQTKPKRTGRHQNVSLVSSFRHNKRKTDERGEQNQLNNRYSFVIFFSLFFYLKPFDYNVNDKPTFFD